jgi:hypothetical protein
MTNDWDLTEDTMQAVSPAPQFMGTCTASLMSHFVTCLLILVVYIIALCSSINRTTFFSLYVHCCPVLDLTQAIVVPCTVVEALCKTLVESESCKIPKV